MLKKIFFLVAVFAISISFAEIILVHSASATSKYSILSDADYLNKRSMSQEDIQSFLVSKKSKLATYKDKGPNETKKMPASYLIWHAAQIWGINPQVILTTLQKEQSLITKQYPQSVDYRSAMGYGCPDSSKCASMYYGFANQVNMATYQFRYNYEALLGNNSFTDVDGDSHPVGTFACAQADSGNKPPFYNNALAPGNTVTFSRNTAFKGSQNKTVSIANKATASFLCYTPHVGPYSLTGYSGSDNFIYYYQLWFGYPFSFEKLAAPSGAVNKVSSSNLGEFTETITDGNKIYTFYYDSTNKSLRLSYWSGSRWLDYVLDGKGSTAHGATKDDVGRGITATMWNGEIQVYYYDATNGSLRHAWIRNSAWRTETLDGTSGGLSHSSGNYGQNAKVIIWHNQLQIYYYDASGKNIRHAWWPGDGRWHFETLSGTAGSATGISADVGNGHKIAATIWKDQIQLYYYNMSSKSLRHTWWPGDGRWHSESLDGTKGSLGKSTDNVGSSVALTLYKGNLQIYYYNTDAGSLRHAWWPGDGRWHFEAMDGEPTTTSSSTLLGNYINAGNQIVAKSIGNELFIFYYDDASHPYWSSGSPYDHTSAWRLAYWKNGMWNQTVLDGSSAGVNQYGSDKAVGGQLSAAVYGSNTLQVYYQGGNGELMHAWSK